MTTRPLPLAASADHLTKVLGRGRVTDVAVVSMTPTILSQIWRLKLTYDGPAEGAPRTLVLKTGTLDKPGGDWVGGRQESAFYSKLAPSTPAGLLLGCFESHYDAETAAWHVLVEDVTDTHMIASQWPLPPTLAQCEAIVRAFAGFHAAWWDHPRLGVDIGEWHDAAWFEQAFGRAGEMVERFSQVMGDGLSPARRDLYKRLLAAGPRLVARQTSRRHMTIGHGDSHVWNCFLPKDGTPGGARLFDWDNWRVDIGADDLSYMMALHWFRDQRAAREGHLLDVYHAALAEAGVAGYDRRALQDDYRYAVLWQTLKPVFLQAFNIPPVIWWNHLERIHQAVDDLDCRELLD